MDCGDTSPPSKRGHVRALQIKTPAQSRGEGTLWVVRNLLLVPHFAFPPSAIIKRKPLSATARRAGWVAFFHPQTRHKAGAFPGKKETCCNFALNRIPVEARIPLVITRSSGRESAPSSLGENRQVRADSRRLLPPLSRPRKSANDSSASNPSKILLSPNAAGPWTC